MAKIKLSDLDASLDDSFQLVELSEQEKEALRGGGVAFYYGAVAGGGSAALTGASLWATLGSAVLGGVAGAGAAKSLAKEPIGWRAGSLSNPT